MRAAAGVISYRLGMLRHRINEKKETNIEDVYLLDEASKYIRDLEAYIAILLDQTHHATNGSVKEPADATG